MNSIVHGILDRDFFYNEMARHIDEFKVTKAHNIKEDNVDLYEEN